MEIWQKNLYALWCMVFVSLAGQASIMPFLPFYIRELGIPEGHSLEFWSGLIYSISFVFICLMGPIWGTIGDRFGHKINITRAVTGITVILILMAFTRNIYELFLLRIFWGMLVGFYPASIALLSNLTPKDKLGQTLGMLQTGVVAGGIAGPLIGGILADMVGYRKVFLIIGLVHLICIGISIWVVKENRDTEFKKSSGNFFGNLKYILNFPTLRVMFIALLAMNISISLVQPVFSLFVEKLACGTTRYISSLTGIIFTSTCITQIIFTPLWGKKGDRGGYKNILVQALLFTGILFLPQALARNPYELLGIRIIFGMAVAGIIPTAYTIMARHSSAEKKGIVFGLASSAGAIGMAIGNFSGGMVGTAFNIRYVFICSGTMLIITAVWITAKLKRLKLEVEEILN